MNMSLFATGTGTAGYVLAVLSECADLSGAVPLRLVMTSRGPFTYFKTRPNSLAQW